MKEKKFLFGILSIIFCIITVFILLIISFVNYWNDDKDTCIDHGGHWNNTKQKCEMKVE